MGQQKKENNFLVHGGILAIASIFVRFIGMIYRIPMVNIIGSEGNGYYSTAYSVYNILLLLSSYSMPLAVSKMVSARIAVGKWKETGRVLAVALVFGIAVGTLFGALAYFGADFFCTKIMNSPMSAIALKWMAPTIFIMAVLGVLRGFFQGLQTTIPTAVSQILEQIINAVVSVVMASVLFKYGTGLIASTGNEAEAPAWGAAGGTIGTGAGALTALIFCIIVFFLFRDYFRRGIASDRHMKVRSYQKLTKILFFTAVPVILSTAAYNCIDIIDAAIFNAVMNKRGMAYEAYSSIWGDYNSAFLLLVHLPVAFASAIASALVPSLSAAYAENDRKKCMSKVSTTMRVTLLIAIPCAFGMMAIGGNLAKLLFKTIDDTAMKYLTAGGLAVIFFSVSTVTNAILQGINKMEKPMFHAVISLIVHTAVLLVLMFVFKLGIYAVIISYTVFGIVMSVLNLLAIYRLTGYTPDAMREIGIPVIASIVVVIICFATAFVVTRFTVGRMANLLIVLISFFAGAAVYAVIILKSGCITKAQLKTLPMGTKAATLFEKMHLLG